MVAAHTCETSATYCVSTRTELVLFFRAGDANSRIVNNNNNNNNFNDIVEAR